MTLDSQVEAALAQRQAKRRGDEITFLCVAHEDATASAAWNRKKGVWNCLAGACGASGSTTDLAERLGIHVETPKERAEAGKIVATYPYRDASGALLFEVVRFSPKAFRRRAPDGTWSAAGIPPVLYRLPELIASGGRVYVAEGEKDVDALRARGLAATCNPGGATETGRSKWYPEIFNEHLRSRDVVILPDRDRAGDNHAAYVARSLAGCARSIRVLLLPGLEWKAKKGPDIADWFLIGGDEDELEALSNAAPEWQPPAESLPTDVGAFALTDVGNGQWFAHLYGDRVRYDYARERWLIWAGHRWQSDPDGAVYRFAKQAAVERRVAGAALDRAFGEEIVEYGYKMESMAKIEAMLKAAQSDPAIKDAGHGWDAQPDLLGCENGVVNLITGELRRATQDDRITMSCGLDYDPRAQAPRWMKCLDEVFLGDQEMIDYWQRVVGYCLTGRTKEQAWFLLWGNGENGKSTLVDTVGKVMGEYAGDTPAETLCGKVGFGSGIASPDVAALQGKRMVTCSETAEAAHINAGRMKWLTGGNPVTARALYRDPVTFTPTFKIIMTTNYLPTVEDASDAYWRRCRLAPFKAKFEGLARQLDLEDVLATELPGILAWAVHGSVRWHAEGLNPPESVMVATNKYRQSSDPLAEFIADCCSVGMDRRATRGQLFGAYKAWAEKQGWGPKDMLGARSFGRKVGERWPNVSSNGSRWYQGIGLRAENDDPTRTADPESNVTQSDVTQIQSEISSPDSETFRASPREREGVSETASLPSLASLVLCVCRNRCDQDPACLDDQWYDGADGEEHHLPHHPDAPHLAQHIEKEI